MLLSLEDVKRCAVDVSLATDRKDMRTKFTGNASSYQTTGKDDFQRDQGAARAISSFIDPSLNWSDLAWFKEITKMPIILKGVQCWEVGPCEIDALTN